MEVHFMKLKFEEEYPTVRTAGFCPVWGFPIHRSCFQLLSVAHLETGRPLDIQAVFDLCRSQPIQYGALNWGHTYGGIMAWNDDPQDLFPTEEPWLYTDHIIGRAFQHDPFNDPCLSKIFSAENEKPAESPGQNPITCVGSSQDPFFILPSEMRVNILIELSSQDVANLRTASRSFASLKLPNQFWRSRFRPGQEFSFIFEANEYPANSGNWKKIYEETKFLQHRLSVVNRKRIWALASEMCNLLTQRAASSISQVHLVPTLFEPGPPIKDHPFIWESASSCTNSATELFQVGSRIISERMIFLPGELLSIMVSLVYINGHSYVSGLSIISQRNEKSLAPPYSSPRRFEIGFIHPKQQQLVDWKSFTPDASPVTGFYVAADPRGIRGLSVLTSEGASSWVGDHEKVPKKFLRVKWPHVHSPKTPITTIKASFDVRYYRRFGDPLCFVLTLIVFENGRIGD